MRLKGSWGLSIFVNNGIAGVIIWFIGVISILTKGP